MEWCEVAPDVQQQVIREFTALQILPCTKLNIDDPGNPFCSLGKNCVDKCPEYNADTRPEIVEREVWLSGLILSGYTFDQAIKIGELRDRHRGNDTKIWRGK